MAQIHPDQPPASISADKIDAALARADVLDPPVAPPSAYTTDREVELLQVQRMTRAGALMIIAFQFAYLGWELAVRPTLPAGAMAYHIGTIVVGFAPLGLTLLDRAWRAQHFRALVFWICAAEIAGMIRIGQLTGVSEPLFVSSLLLIIGSGATIPWEPRWQASFNIVAPHWTAALYPGNLRWLQ